jgi:outer membrane protein assembly factor BamA
MSRIRRLLPALLLFLVGLPTSSASNTYVQICQIQVEGNKRTKTQVILRELDFSEGDTISLLQLQQRLQRNRIHLMNLGLFISVSMNIPEWTVPENEISVSIEVQEAWYVYPLPWVELADRNFNVWWVEYNRSLRRLDYSFEFAHNNFSGYRDRFRVLAQIGFTQKFEFAYQLPYLNQAQTLGVETDWMYKRTRDVNFMTSGDQQVFFRGDNLQMFQFFRGNVTLTYRPRLRDSHSWQVGYQSGRIAPELAEELNPDFFLHSRQQQQAIRLEYQFMSDYRDVRAYPMDGYFLKAGLIKLGFLGNDVRALQMHTLYQQVHAFSSRWSFEWIARGQFSLLRHKQPFFNSAGMGYGDDYLRGFEYYVVDGLDFGFLKQTLRYKTLDTELNWGRAMPFENMRIMPLRIYLTAFFDTGFANNPYYAEGNQLPNRILLSGGVGVNLVTYYDKVFIIELSRNDLGETGIFLHWRLGM